MRSKAQWYHTILRRSGTKTSRLAEDEDEDEDEEEDPNEEGEGEDPDDEGECKEPDEAMYIISSTRRTTYTRRTKLMRRRRSRN